MEILTFGVLEQRNNESISFPSLTKLFSGTMECMPLQPETHYP